MSQNVTEMRPDDPRFLDLVAKEMAAAPVASLHLKPSSAISVIALMQLALRHPENTGPSRQIAYEMIGAIRAQIARPGSAMDALIQMGFDPKYDVEREREGQAHEAPHQWERAK